MILFGSSNLQPIASCGILVLSGVLSTVCFPREMYLLGDLPLLNALGCSAALGDKQLKLKSVSRDLGQPVAFQ